jgi:hypothetical protein
MNVLNLGSWLFARVLAVSIAWVVLMVVQYAVRMYLNLRLIRGDGAGVGAFSIAVGPMLPVLFGPPILLFVVWLGWKLWQRAV